MASSFGDMNKIKIFVLYLMRNINYPMDFVTINDVVMQTDYVLFIDFEEAFHQMLEGDLICEDGKNEEGNTLYSVTRKGALVAEQLKSDILPSLLDQSLTYALRYLDFKRRGVTMDCFAERCADATYNVTVELKEKGKIILKTTINVDSETRAHQVTKLFYDRPDVIYRGTVALLLGKVNYRFDNK